MNLIPAAVFGNTELAEKAKEILATNLAPDPEAEPPAPPPEEEEEEKSKKKEKKGRGGGALARFKAKKS